MQDVETYNMNIYGYMFFLTTNSILFKIKTMFFGLKNMLCVCRNFLSQMFNGVHIIGFKEKLKIFLGKVYGKFEI